MYVRRPFIVGALALTSLAPDGGSSSGTVTFGLTRVVRQASGASTDPVRVAEALLAAASDEARSTLLGTLPPGEVRDVARALIAASDRARVTGQFASGVVAARLAIRLIEPTRDDALRAQALSALGAVLTARSDVGEALDVLTQSRSLSRAQGDMTTYAEATGRLSYLHFVRGDAEDALRTADECLALRRQQGRPADIAQALNYLAMAKRLRGDYTESVEHYTEALELSERAGADDQLARTLNNLAVVERERGMSEEALRHYEKSLAINERLGNRAGVANTLSNLGLSYQDQGLYELALDRYGKGLAIAEEIGDRRMRARLLSHIGFVYRGQGNSALAMDYYRRALEEAEAIGFKDEIARDLHFMARVLLQRGDYAASAALLDRAIALRRSMKDPAGTANLVLDYGRLYELQSDLDRALEQYAEGLRLLEQAGERRSLSHAYLRLSAAHERRGDHQAALQAAKDGLFAVEQTGQHARAWSLQLALGRAYRGLGDTAHAREAFERSIEGVEALRNQVAGADEDQQRAFERSVGPYHEMVDLLASNNDAHGALTYAERAKGRVLFDVLRNGRVTITKAMSAAEQDGERRLNADVVAAATVVQRERQRSTVVATRVAAAVQRLEAAQVQLDTFRLALYARYPQLKVQRSEQPPILPADLETLVGDGRTALVEYVVTMKATWAFVARRAEPGAAGGQGFRLSVHRINASSQVVEQQVNEFRARLARRDLGFRLQARALHALVLEPLLAGVAAGSRLVIVPEGPLWDLPFQALTSAEGRFVIERFAVSYAPSLTVLRELSLVRRSRAAPAAVLAFGNPSSPRAGNTSSSSADRSATLVSLPSAAEEARALRRLYGPG